MHLAPLMQAKLVGLQCQFNENWVAVSKIMENPRHDRHATSHQYALQVIEFDTQHLTALYHIPQTHSTSLYTLYYLPT